MAYTPPYTTCTTCNGDGIIGDGLCQECFGGGSLPIHSKDVFCIRDLFSKLDAVMAEQAAQRADLTAALTQIWNKVKDL